VSETDKAASAKLEGQIQVLNGYRRKLEKIQALWDVGHVPTIRLLQRGSAESPGPKVTPGFLSVVCASGDCAAVRPDATQGQTSGLRLAFAHWLTSRNNPLTARVIVNRIWQGHFGKGIVETPDNFGKMGSPPTHPELLDWLAVDFMQHGWSAKRLHRLILTSTVYRQSSRQTAEPRVAKANQIDPDNHLLWRMNLRRLEAEALRDAVLAVSGKLNVAMGGPAIMLKTWPNGLETVSDPDAPSGAFRRSVYLLARRTYPLTFLGVFDYPIIDATCPRRVPSATPLQSLTLLNDEFIVQSARDLAERGNRLAGDAEPDPRKIEDVFTLALARSPSKSEIAISEEYLHKQRELNLAANLTEKEARGRALASLAQMLLGSNEFLYVE
jgi:hypothetical protein